MPKRRALGWHRTVMLSTGMIPRVKRWPEAHVLELFNEQKFMYKYKQSNTRAQMQTES